MSADARHHILRISLYVGIFLTIAYFFNIIIDANKKITYIGANEFNISNAKHATVLDGDKNLLVEDRDGKTFIVEDFDKKALEQSGVSYGHENKTIDQVIKYTLSIALFVMVILLAIT